MTKRKSKPPNYLQLLKAYQQSPTGLIVHRRDGTITAVNPAWCSMIGHRSRDMVGHKCKEFEFEVDDNCGKSSLAAAYSGTVQFERRYRRHDGAILYTLAQLSLNEVNGGEQSYALTLIDITKLKVMESNLTVLESVVNNTQDCIVITEADQNERSCGRILFANPAFLRLYGYRSEEVIGKPVMRRLFDTHDESVDLLRLADALQEKRSERTQLLTHAHDGRQVWIDIVFLPMTMNNVSYWIMIFRDITDSRRHLEMVIEQKTLAEEANRAKSEFVANMSHELRTPLNAILGFSEVMLLGIYGQLDSRYREYASAVFDSGRHLLNLIDDVLDISQIEVGKRQFVETEFDLSEVMAECRQIIDGRARANGIALTMAPAPGIRLFADRRAIKQIIINLLGNAIKFTPSGGAVMVQSKAAHNGICAISVRDNGPGMTRDIINRIGTRFLHAEPVFTKSHGGLGLGLSLVKELVLRHHAKIYFDSQVGRGTVVRVLFPKERTRP